MASMYNQTKCQPDTVVANRTAISAAHRVAGKPSPTDDELVADTRVSKGRLHTAGSGTLPEQRGTRRRLRLSLSWRR